MSVLHHLVHVKVEIRQHVDLVDNQRVAHCEDQGVLQGLVVALGHGKDHGVFHRAGVELRGAHQVAHILQHHQVQVIGAQLPQSLLGHPGVQVAHAAGVQLDGPDPGVGHGGGVHVGVDVRLHNAHAQLILQALHGPQQGGSLAAARRGHQIQQEGALLFQLLPDPVCLPVVVGENAFLHLDDFIFVHRYASFLWIFQQYTIFVMNMQTTRQKIPEYAKNYLRYPPDWGYNEGTRRRQIA